MKKQQLDLVKVKYVEHFGEIIPGGAIVRLWAEYVFLRRKEKLTWYEMLTGKVWKQFASVKVDECVLTISALDPTEKIGFLNYQLPLNGFFKTHE